jgi:hypothetical protein
MSIVLPRGVLFRGSDDKLKVIAAELITQVRKSVTIDRTLCEGTRAKIRVMGKRILNKCGYWLPHCRRSVGLWPVLRTACLSRPAPSARPTCSGLCILIPHPSGGPDRSARNG